MIFACNYATTRTPADLLTQFTHPITLHTTLRKPQVTRALMGESWFVWGGSWHLGESCTMMSESDQTKQTKQTNPGGPPGEGLAGVTPGAAELLRHRCDDFDESHL